MGYKSKFRPEPTHVGLMLFNQDMFFNQESTIFSTSTIRTTEKSLEKNDKTKEGVQWVKALVI